MYKYHVSNFCALEGLRNCCDISVESDRSSIGYMPIYQVRFWADGSVTVLKVKRYSC